MTKMNHFGGKARNITKVLLSRRSCCFTQSSRCLKSQPPAPIEEGQSEKFTQSVAAKWKSFDTFSPSRAPSTQDNSRPRAEPFVVSITVSIFLAYFLFLREENDVDKEMDKPLYERLPTLERAQLKAQIRQQQREGMDAGPLQSRLQEVNKEIARRRQQHDN